MIKSSNVATIDEFAATDMDFCNKIGNGLPVIDNGQKYHTK